jgi:hypothetical protein
MPIDISPEAVNRAARTQHNLQHGSLKWSDMTPEYHAIMRINAREVLLAAAGPLSGTHPSIFVERGAFDPQLAFEQLNEKVEALTTLVSGPPSRVWTTEELGKLVERCYGNYQDANGIRLDYDMLSGSSVRALRSFAKRVILEVTNDTFV